MEVRISKITLELRREEADLLAYYLADSYHKRSDGEVVNFIATLASGGNGLAKKALDVRAEVIRLLGNI